MGNNAVKPEPPADTKAAQNTNLMVEQLGIEAEHFFQSVRLGDANKYSLGYKICDNVLTDQEFHIHVQSEFNQSSEKLKAGVKSIFSGDWEAVTELAVDVLLPFLSGAPPKPEDQAMTDIWAKSYLTWEDGTLMNTSIYVKKTNASSVGTLTESTQQTLLACVCRGAVDFANVDPQVLLYEVRMNMRKAGRPTSEIENIFQQIEEQMGFAVRKVELKRKMEAGLSANTDTGAKVSKSNNY